METQTRMKKLKEAVKLAHLSKTKRTRQTYHLCAIAKRQDGTYTHAINNPAQFPARHLHAEYKVLMKSGRGVETMWVGRSLADGKWGMAKPCKFCMSIIKNMGVKTVYYTISENEYGCIKL